MRFRILTMIATSDSSDCTTLVFSWGSASSWAAYSAPKTPNWFKGALLLTGGERKGSKVVEEG